MLSMARQAVRLGRRAGRFALGRISAAATALGWHARPAFMIVGAQKSGTTALHRYLSDHPRITPAFGKELYFFSPESFHAYPEDPGYDWFARVAEGDNNPAIRAETLRWYHAQFPVPIPGRRQLYFESTTCYLYFPEVAPRIHAYRPDMKLIVLLRDPVERAYSSWSMARQWTEYPESLQQDRRTFEEALRDELAHLEHDPKTLTTDYLRRGIYQEQLRRYLAVFPREQILIVDQGELLTNHTATMDAICRFLGVPRIARGNAPPRHNVGNYAVPMAPATREFLADFFAPHDSALFELIGREFDWTSQRERPAKAPGKPAPATPKVEVFVPGGRAKAGS